MGVQGRKIYNEKRCDNLNDRVQITQVYKVAEETLESVSSEGEPEELDETLKDFDEGDPAYYDSFYTKEE